MHVKCIGIICGGKSVEHEVSLQSAKNIIQVLEQTYQVVVIGISKQGLWYVIDLAKLKQKYLQEAMFALEEGSNLLEKPLSFDLLKNMIDLAFCVVHGAYGEDGCIQGLLRCLDIAFIGPSVLDAALCMDKDICKRLLQAEGIVMAKFLTYKAYDHFSFEEVVFKLGLPLFVKPSNSGSSLGVAKVVNESEFKIAIEEAFKYDHKILIEEAIVGREIECSVLGNDQPRASLPGEVIPTHEFYSYEAKYLDDKGAEFALPALLEDVTRDQIQELAVKIFKSLGCHGMARVDFFLDNQGVVYFNEINTIPGFTQISLYPKLWEVSGLAITNLLDNLIQLALEKYSKDRAILTSATTIYIEG